MTGPGVLGRECEAQTQVARHHRARRARRFRGAVRPRGPTDADRVRHHAAGILGVIGTEKCLPALSKLESDGYTPAKEAAQKAYKYVRARQEFRGH